MSLVKEISTAFDYINTDGLRIMRGTLASRPIATYCNTIYERTDVPLQHYVYLDDKWQMGGAEQRPKIAQPGMFFCIDNNSVYVWVP